MYYSDREKYQIGEKIYYKELTIEQAMQKYQITRDEAENFLNYFISLSSNNDNNNGNNAAAAIAIVAIIALMILSIIFPLLSIIYDYTKIRFKKLRKPDGNSFLKFRKIYLLLAILYYVIFVLTIILIVAPISFDVTAGIYLIMLPAIAYLITYCVFYSKCLKKDGDSVSDAQAINDFESDGNSINSSNVLDYDKEFEIVSLLKNYKNLLDDGILTEEEFHSKKQELLHL